MNNRNILKLINQFITMIINNIAVYKPEEIYLINMIFKVQRLSKA